MIQKLFTILASACVAMTLVSCFGSNRAMNSGGEVTSSRGTTVSEPTPYGMVEIKRGHCVRVSKKTTRSGAKRFQRATSLLTASGWTKRK